MSRNLKALGLALVAVFAMSAIVVTAAHAEDQGRVVIDENTEGHIGDEAAAFVTAADEGEENPLALTAFGEAVACAKNHFHGEVEGGTHESITLNATFGGPKEGQECEAEGRPTTIDNNGCHLRFDTFESITTETWEATADLACPEEKPGIQVTVFAGGEHSFRVCTLTVPSQEGIEKVVLHNNVNTTPEHTEPHDLTLTAEATNITAHRSGLCGGASTEEAQIDGEATVTAETEFFEPVDIYVEHRPGRVVTDETTEGHVAGAVLATDSGVENSLLFTAFEGETSCSASNLRGEVESGTATELTLEAELGGPQESQECEAGGLPSTIDNNGCHLRFDTFLADTESTWEATADLACPEGEPGIQVTTFAGGAHGFGVCTMTVPPQEGRERVVLHNNVNTKEEEPHGDPHDITLTAEIDNLTMHRSGLCGAASTAEAQIHGEMTITAENADEEPIDIYIEYHE